MGKVSLPHSSGVLTISLVISLHDRHTDAQATTCLLAGHNASLASTRLITSRSSSGGRFAQRLCWPDEPWKRNTFPPAFWDRARLCTSFPSVPRLDMLPIPSLISLSSRTMLLNDIETDLISFRSRFCSPMHWKPQRDSNKDAGFF